MESAKVIEAAKTMINHIKAERKKYDEEVIAKAMTQKMFSFKRGFYKMTYNEAKAWVNKQNWCSSWGWSIYGSGTLSEAKKLLNLAQHGDPVTLNENDIENLML